MPSWIPYIWRKAVDWASVIQPSTQEQEAWAYSKNLGGIGTFGLGVGPLTCVFHRPMTESRPINPLGMDMCR